MMTVGALSGLGRTRLCSVISIAFVTISRLLEEKLSEITLADVKKDIAVYILYIKV